MVRPSAAPTLAATEVLPRSASTRRLLGADLRLELGDAAIGVRVPAPDGIVEGDVFALDRTLLVLENNGDGSFRPAFIA